MKFLNRFLAVLLLLVLIGSNIAQAYTKRVSRDILFSTIIYTENTSVLENPGSLWRKAVNGDQISSFTSFQALSNLNKKKTSSFVYFIPRKNQVFSTEMDVSSGKLYQFQEFVRTSKMTSTIVRIRWDDNTTTRIKVGTLPALPNWNKVQFTFRAPE